MWTLPFPNKGVRDKLQAFHFLKFGVHFQVAIFLTLICGYFISTSSFRVALSVILLVLSILSPVQAKKEVSLFDFTLKVVTTISCFAVKEFHSILFGIVADRSLTFIIQLRIDRIFLDDQFPLVTSNSLLQSNQHHPPNLSNLPVDMICEIVDRLPNFKDIRAISAVCNPCVGWYGFFFFFFGYVLHVQDLCEWRER